MSQQPAVISLSAPVGPGDHIQGPKSAKVTVVEYGDFECPACGQAHGAVRLLRDRFGDRLCFVFRHFPLRDVHPCAELAAEAAEAAGSQHRFWQMYDLLLENQSHLTAGDLRQYAARAELDLKRFDSEMQDRLYAKRVQRDIASGKSSYIQCTPAFFVNGVLRDVSFGLEHLERAIECDLGQ